MVIKYRLVNIPSLSDEFRRYVEKKLEKIGTALEHLGGKREVWLELGKETEHHRQGNVFIAKLDVVVSRHTFRSQARRVSLEQAIDEAKDEMMTELQRAKDRTISDRRRRARLFKWFMRRLGRSE